MLEVWYLPKTVNCDYCGRFGRWRIKGETTGNEALDVCTRCKDFAEKYAEKVNHEQVVFRGTLR